MRPIKRCGPVAALSVAIFLALGRAGGQDLVVGINVVNPMRNSMANQNALLDELKAGGVHIIAAASRMTTMASTLRNAPPPTAFGSS